MLAQILRDLWVDPEILSELDEDQKQTLFCRMREEQVRRWKLWDEKGENLQANDKRAKKKCEKSVKFRLGSDGEPWVWVMGEHPDDKTIDQILVKEARKEARRLAEQEAEQLRRKVEAELTELLDFSQQQIAAMEAETLKSEAPAKIYSSPNDIVLKNNNQNNINTKKIENDINNKLIPNNIIKKPEVPLFCFGDNTETVLEEIGLKPTGVAQKIAQWEERMKERRTTELFNCLRHKQIQVAEEAERDATQHEQLWREQERKAKEAELQIRQIARRAREEHRRMSCTDSFSPVDIKRDGSVVNGTTHSHELPTSPAQSPSTSPIPSPNQQSNIQRPPNKDAVITWFQTKEIQRGAAIESNQVAPWFHGLITRQEAEQKLSEMPLGSFLVRLSERIWGYAISYKASDRFKHYLVDAENGHYQFFGNNQVTHITLGELVRYHSNNPITLTGGERLQFPCPRPDILDIFDGVASVRW